MKPQVLAYYLPQYHPIIENNEWFGEGFTEWTNVGRAKPLFKGHYQPRVPADLGYYDLRVPEVRVKQAELAKQAGIDAFCYYHYWFGDGHTIMQKPFWDMVNSASPDYPFCLCWANHDWYKKDWDPHNRSIKMKATIKVDYSDPSDIVRHFNYLLPAFKDKRYYKIDNRLVFVIYLPKLIPYIEEMMKTWNQLAKDNGIPEFFFIGHTSRISDLEDPMYQCFDSVILELLRRIELGDNPPRWKRGWNLVVNWLAKKVNRPLYLYKYKKAIKYLLDPISSKENVIPTIIPNWDWSPRKGPGGLIFHDSTPELFKSHVKEALELIKDKPEDRQILVLKSWNEWGEGNYMEPDLRYGHGYIDALAEALLEYQNKQVESTKA